MAKGRSTLVQTVGTSLLTNLSDARILENYETWVATQPSGDQHALREYRQAVEGAAAALQQHRLPDVAAHLGEVGGRLRVLGAEVASLDTLRGETAYAGLRSVVLLHSDTADGLAAATVLEALLPRRVGVAAERRRIESMHDARPSEFKVRGLRNLVHELARVTRARGADDVVIDATGGFKAQIATAVAFGQAFGIPVLYLFERFPEVIEFPPLPLCVDLALAERHRDLLEQGEIDEASLQERFGGPLSEANPGFSAFAICLSGPEERAGRRVWGVSPMGQLLLELWQTHRAPAS